MTQKRIAEILNKGHKGDKWSVRVDLTLAFLILANLIAVVLESLEPPTRGFSIRCITASVMERQILSK